MSCGSHESPQFLDQFSPWEPIGITKGDNQFENKIDNSRPSENQTKWKLIFIFYFGGELGWFYERTKI
jgi:hypothetical protein